MDWPQVLTLIGTISALTGASTWAIYTITNSKIDMFISHHREDIKSMDAKWERLFEKLLVKEEK